MIEKIKYLERLTKIIRKHVGMDDVQRIIEKFGGKIVHDPSLKMTDALIEKEGELFVIKINLDKDEKSVNFQLAHVFGHVCLHMGLLVDKEHFEHITCYDDTWTKEQADTDSLENFEADMFAFLLTMPTIHGAFTLKDYSKIYNVPVEVIDRRIQLYNYIGV